MSFKDKITYYFDNNWVTKMLNNTVLKNHNNISIIGLIRLLFENLSHGIFGLRIAAVSWILFFSLFPFLLFLFSIFPYVPLYDEIQALLFTKMIPKILPETVSHDVIEYIINTVANQEKTGGISWFYMLITIYMSSNGIYGFLNGFRSANSASVYERRKNTRQRILSIILTILFVVLIIALLFLLYYSNFIWRYVDEHQSLTALTPLLYLVNYASTFLVYYLVVYVLYRYGAKAKNKKITVFPGAVLASVLFFITVYGFNLYLKNFNNFDFLYGSLGLVMIVMIFIYINVFIILFGFELNLALNHARYSIITVDGKIIRLDKHRHKV